MSVTALFITHRDSIVPHNHGFEKHRNLTILTSYHKASDLWSIYIYIFLLDVTALIVTRYDL